LFSAATFNLSAEFHFIRVGVTKLRVQGRLKIHCVWLGETCKTSGGYAGHNTNLIKKAHEIYPCDEHLTKYFMLLRDGPDKLCVDK
jgi:hypothetical protein